MRRIGFRAESGDGEPSVQGIGYVAPRSEVDRLPSQRRLRALLTDLRRAGVERFTFGRLDISFPARRGRRR